MQADLILYALVAAGLVFWLRSILGTRHGDERERPNPFTAAPQTEAAVSDDAIAGLPLVDVKPALPRNVSVSGEEVERGLSEIARKDPDFDIARFSVGAQDAFALIVESFAAGDRETLQPLLEPSVYEAFDKSITAREQSGETVSTEIHAVRKADILDVRQDAQKIFITVRFIADETCIVKNRDGAIISGDPERVVEMNDIWVFSKPVKSRDPRWFLSETRDGDVKEEHRTAVPDAR